MSDKDPFISDEILELGLDRQMRKLNELADMYQQQIKNTSQLERNERLFMVAIKYLDFWTHPEVTLSNNRVRDYNGMGSEEKVSFEHHTKYIINNCFDSAELFLEEYYKRIGEGV